MQKKGFKVRKWGLFDIFYLNIKTETLTDFDIIAKA